MIEFRDVHASYGGGLPVLRDVSFTIEDGEFVAFAGTNGAGKSTTMRLINGLLKPDQGEVLLDGTPTTQLKVSETARRVGFLFQNPDSQICCNTVHDELAFGFKAQGLLDDEAEGRIESIASILKLDLSADPFLLNRGSRQLLALASIAVMETPVLVLDEPTTGLDYHECCAVMDLIGQMHEKGATVVMVCHDMEVVADYAERLIVMNAGQVVESGPTFKVLRNPATVETASLVPPQIVGISLACARRDPGLAGTPVASANTLDEMIGALQTAAQEGRRSA